MTAYDKSKICQTDNNNFRPHQKYHYSSGRNSVLISIRERMKQAKKLFTNSVIILIFFFDHILYDNNLNGDNFGGYFDLAFHGKKCNPLQSNYQSQCIAGTHQGKQLFQTTCVNNRTH